MGLPGSKSYVVVAGSLADGSAADSELAAGALPMSEGSSAARASHSRCVDGEGGGCSAMVVLLSSGCGDAFELPRAIEEKDEGDAGREGGLVATGAAGGGGGGTGAAGATGAAGVATGGFSAFALALMTAARSSFEKVRRRAAPAGVPLMRLSASSFFMPATLWSLTASNIVLDSTPFCCASEPSTTPATTTTPLL